MEDKKEEPKLFDHELNSLQSKICDYQNGINTISTKLRLLASVQQPMTEVEDDLGDYNNITTTIDKLRYMNSYMNIINMRLDRALDHINTLV